MSVYSSANIQGFKTTVVQQLHTLDLENYQFPLQSFNSGTCTKSHESVAFIVTRPTEF
jgi:hypothetical protein